MTPDTEKAAGGRCICPTFPDVMLPTCPVHSPRPPEPADLDPQGHHWVMRNIGGAVTCRTCGVVQRDVNEPCEAVPAPTPEPVPLSREELVREMVKRLEEYLATLPPEEAERRMREAEIAAGLRGKESW